MTEHNFYEEILSTLQGQTAALKDIPPERLDWSGASAILALYRGTSGTERNHLIQAIGQVIRHHSASPAVIAQVIQIASALDISQVEPEVRQLQKEPFGDQEPVRGAIANYLAFRELNAAPKTPLPLTRHSSNGRSKTAKRKKTTRSGR